jgi:hypothetical protein
MDAPVWALIDSGCEHVLAAPGLARAIGLDLAGATRKVELGIGGDTVPFHFLDATVRIHPPDASVDEFVEWEAEIGFGGTWKAPWSILLGQHGFFDMFTLSMHRQVGAAVVDEYGAMDRHYGRR